MNEQLKIIISAEITKFKQNVENAKKQVSSFKEQVAKASKDVDKNFKAIGNSMVTGAKAAATGLTAASAALLALGASTQEYRNEQAKLVTAFEAAGGSAEDAKETYNDLFRVLGDSGQATEAAAHLAKLTTEEKALSEWTTICQGVYATFGASLPIEGLTEAANETAKVGVVTGSLADALNWAGISEDDFNAKLEACNNEAEREKLIRETLNGLYSDAAAKYEENNAQVLAQNEAQAKLQATTAALGEAVAPVITAFTNLASQALAAVVPYVQSLADNYLPALTEVLGRVGESLGKALGFLVDNWNIVLAVAGVIGGITAAIGLYNAVAAVKAAMAALEVTTVWGLVAAYAAQAAAMIVAIAPYLLIVAAIAAVIAIIVLCVKHWDKIVEATKNAWKWIQEKTAEAVNAVVNWFTKLKDKATSKFNEIKQSITNIFNGIKSAISNALQAAQDLIVNKFTNGMNKAKNIVSSVIDKIKGFFKFNVSLPKIKLPHFAITPKGWELGDLLKGSIPKLGIEWYAKGGVFDKPTLFAGNGGLNGLGEYGAEAVVPLERNLEWLDKLAAMLADKMGSDKPLVLTVDGNIFAETAINTINQRTRQTGKLALNIM